MEISGSAERVVIVVSIRSDRLNCRDISRRFGIDARYISTSLFILKPVFIYTGVISALYQLIRILFELDILLRHFSRQIKQRPLSALPSPSIRRLKQLPTIPHSPAPKLQKPLRDLPPGRIPGLLPYQDSSFGHTIPTHIMTQFKIINRIRRPNQIIPHLRDGDEI